MKIKQFIWISIIILLMVLMKINTQIQGAEDTDNSLQNFRNDILVIVHADSKLVNNIQIPFAEQVNAIGFEQHPPQYQPTATPQSLSIEELLESCIQHFNMGALDDALSDCETIVTHPQSTDNPLLKGFAALVVGRIYHLRQQYDEALQYYEVALFSLQAAGDRELEETAIFNIGAVYNALGQYEQAMSYYEQALVIARDIGDRAGEELTLNDMGTLYYKKGQYKQALEYYQQALIIAREQGNSIEEGTTLNNLGETYSAQGEYEQAVEYFQQALALAHAAGNTVMEGTILNNLGKVYDSQGQYEQALACQQQALALALQVGDRTLQGTAFHNMGAVYKHEGQYQQALEYYQQALLIRREVGDRAGEGATINNIGAVYNSRGQYEQALSHYQQSLTIMQELNDLVGQGTVLNSIGTVYANQGNYGNALKNFEDALTLAQTLGNQVGEVQSLNNIGELYSRQNQYVNALTYLNQALGLAQSLGDRADEGVILHNIGKAYYSQEQPESALERLEQALTIWREIGSQANEAVILNMIGTVYNSQGQYELALTYYEQALVIDQAVGNRSEEGILLANIATVLLSQGQYEQAHELSMEALDILREVGNRQSESLVLNNIAFTYDMSGERQSAIQYYKESTTLIIDVLGAAGLESSISSIAGNNNNTMPFHRLAVLLTQDGHVDEALNYAELGQAFLLRTELINQPIDFRVNLDQSLLDQEIQLRLALNFAQTTYDTLYQDISASRDDIETARTALRTIQNDYQEHLTVMQLHGGFLARQIAHEAASLSQIQAAIPVDTTLLVYVISSPNSVVFLITNNSLNAVILDVGQDDISNIVNVFETDVQANAKVLRTLYDLIFAPIADQITTSRLLIVPDGPLNMVPFAALQASENQYLIDRYAISTVASATTLVLLNDRAQKTLVEPPSPGLILAQPSAPGLPQLRYANAEAQAVADLLGVTADVNATEADLRASSSDSAIIYISAHAQLDRFAPPFSVIYLGAGQGYDGHLEAREVYELDLTQGTELVVLSGCNTASGGSGEDFGVFTRAFLGVGVPRVVGSLWSVDDQATADLIVAFIAERANYDNDAEALRTAILTIKQKYPEPYYWAGFVLNGLP